METSKRSTDTLFEAEVDDEYVKGNMKHKAVEIKELNISCHTKLTTKMGRKINFSKKSSVLMY